MELNDSQIDALCTLLEDERPGVSAIIDRQIAALSESDCERLFDRLLAASTRPKTIPPALEEFHYKRLERAFSDWAVPSLGEPRLEEGMLLLASFGYPLEDMSECVAVLDRIADELKSQLEGLDEARAIVDRTARYLHEELGFEGNREDYYDVDNSYFNRVLERRCGIPISLSALYLLLGQRMGLPYRGVGMPGHFIVKYESPENPVYTDPFNGGQILTVGQCEEIVRGLGYHFDIRFLKETSDARIVERMINNLIGIYQREGDVGRSQQLARYREIIQRI